jgi:hypothetical protein
MKKETRSYFEMLLAAAFESSTFRVLQSVPNLNPHTLALAYDAARTATRKLGYYCKRYGGDARCSPLFEGIEFKEDYVQCYESYRRVSPEVLTPKLIHDCTTRGNCVLWDGWSVSLWPRTQYSGIGAGRETILVLMVEHTDGRRHELLEQGKPHERARQAYRMVTGMSYRWDDAELSDDSGFAADYLALS